MKRLALPIVLLALLVAGCAPALKDTTATSSTIPQSAPAPDTSAIAQMSPEQKRASIAPGFLIEVPVPEGEVTRARAQGDTAWDYDITVDADAAALAEWYRQAYVGRGWTLVEQGPGSMTFRKAAAQSRVEVAEGDAPASATVVVGVGTEVLQTQ